MSKLVLPPPVDIGLPERFSSWRQGQPEAIEFAIDDPRRFKGLVLPTGAGKSLIYMTVPQLTGWRTVILTSTKALQRQLVNDFASDTTALMQGQRNYECLAVQPGRELSGAFGSASTFTATVDQGPCHSGVACSLQESGCGYYDAIRAIFKAQVVITNYAWWFSLVMNPKITLRPDLLVLDEAHAAPDALADAIGATLKVSDVREFLPNKHYEMPDDVKATDAWVEWAGRSAAKLASMLEGTRAHDRDTARRLRRGQSIFYALSRIAKIEPALLIVTPEMDGTELKFDVVWAAEYAEPWLFRGVPRVILTSATMSKHTGEMLGIMDKHLGLFEAGEGFDLRRRPVYVLPAQDVITGSRVNVDHRIDARREAIWLAHIDKILTARGDRKGIIHSISYGRRDMLMAKSACRDRMMTHGRHDAAERIAQYRQAPRDSGAILVSPAVTTGYDFPGDECEYQIVAKIPFPDGRDPITASRSLVDKKYPSYLAMQQLVQMAGRGMRSADDRCETFLVDGHASWFMSKHADLAPKWFRRAVRHVTEIPAAPPRVNVQPSLATRDGDSE